MPQPSPNPRRIVIDREISADRLTPVAIVEALSTEMQDGVILESGMHHQDAGRHSFIAFGSMAKLYSKNQLITKIIGTECTTLYAHPLIVLRQLLTEMSCDNHPDTTDFINGAFGFVTYDAIRLFENIPDRHISDNHLPDMVFNFYQTILKFDHVKQTLLINRVVEVGDNPAKTYQETQEYITTLIKKITTVPVFSNRISQTKQHTELDVDISDEQFIQMVERAKQYIINGDAFQIVLSRRFTLPYSGSPFDIYRALRRVSPAPYMFYFPFEDSVILGASPEKLISVHNRQIEMHPIAGTRVRTAKTQDDEITQELLNDPKETAEHMMLVDLARNDIGSVSEPGSVKVKELLRVKHFSHVSHITSCVTGRLRGDKDALDALAAAFPAGTLSGAPKIRAMQIIDELETSRRGLYGGAIYRLDNQGNLDSCIAIRMAILKEGRASVRAGAGIVYDSNPKSEANETRQKAQGVLAAIQLAEEGLE